MITAETNRYTGAPQGVFKCDFCESTATVPGGRSGFSYPTGWKPIENETVRSLWQWLFRVPGEPKVEVVRTEGGGYRYRYGRDVCANCLTRGRIQ